MRITITILSLLLLVTSCKNEVKQENEPETIETPEEEIVEEKKVYPEGLQRVFEAHGGLEHWEKMQQFSFQLIKASSNEMYQFNLNPRKGMIQGPNFTIGSDGETIWLKEFGKRFKKNPDLYHNLYFYFATMPFIFTNDEVKISKTGSLRYQNIMYPGYKISYPIEVENNAKANYFLYYHPQTYKISWLGYNLVKDDGTTDPNIRMLRYTKFKVNNGLLFPSALTWYRYSNGRPGKKMNSMRISDISVSEEAFGDDFFEKPDDAL